MNRHYHVPLIVIVVVVQLLFIHNTMSIYAASSSSSSSASIIENDNNMVVIDEKKQYIYKDSLKDIRYQIDQNMKNYYYYNHHQGQQERSIMMKDGVKKGILPDLHHQYHNHDHHYRQLKESIMIDSSKLDQTLTSLVNIHNTYNMNGPLTRIDSLFHYDSVRIINNDRVLVDVVGKHDDDVLRVNGTTDDTSSNSIKIALINDGYNVINCVQNICSMYILIDELLTLSKINYIHSIRPAISITNIGSVTSEGDIAMYTDQVRLKYNVDGTGILIGVLSDSYNCLNGALNDIQTNDLPQNSNDIIIVSDLTSLECNGGNGGSDEGRAMMQILYDIAPGAKLAFRTAFRGQADFAIGIRELANISCDIIVDDIRYFVEPFYQDGIIAQAVDDVVTNHGIIYFSSIGNSGMSGWDAPNGFIPSNISDIDNEYQYHSFGTTTTTSNNNSSSNEPIIYQIVSIPNINTTLVFNFQWSEPSYSVSSSGSSGSGSKSDIDIFFIYNTSIVAASVNDNIKNGDPYEIIYFNPSSIGSNDTFVNVQFYIALYTGPAPKYMKCIYVSGSRVKFEYSTAGTSTTFGHANTEFGAGVGAANYNQTPAYNVTPPIIESFSSFGGTPILFDTFGNILSSKIIRQQPRFVGPNGGLTTFFGTNENRFFGTSASAPHVAGLAALILQRAGGRKSLTPAEVYKILQETAIDMNDNSTVGFDVGFDFNTGYGFVNGSAALEQTPYIIVKENCGLFGLNLFCPFTFCGFFGRLLFNLC